MRCSITARDATQLSATRALWILNKGAEKLRDFLSGKVLLHHFTVVVIIRADWNASLGYRVRSDSRISRLPMHSRRVAGTARLK